MRWPESDRGRSSRQILSYGMSNDPGVAFEYSNSSAHLVAAVLQNAVDRPILDYAREKLFDPLGIDTRPAWQGWDTGSPTSGFNKPGFAWATDGAGVNLGAFGLKLTATDLVKLGELYVNGGRWHGRQIVSQAWVDESTSDQLSDQQAEAAQAQYGYLWWTGENKGHAWFEASGSTTRNHLFSRARSGCRRHSGRRPHRPRYTPSDAGSHSREGDLRPAPAVDGTSQDLWTPKP